MASEESGKRWPLEGIRVIDLTKIVAGPNCTRMLATMGAEVIRVEWHDDRALDLLRMVRPYAPDTIDGSMNRSGLFNNINPGKYGVTLNLSLPQGRALFKKLIAKADVLCENYSPNQMQSWDLGYDSLRSINPRLIYLQITGMGKSGTYNGYVSVGPTAQALSGLTHMSGLPEPQPPAGWGYSYLDHSTGYYGSMLVMVALLKRRRTGEGCYIDVSQTEVGIMASGTATLEAQLTGKATARMGNRSRLAGVAPHGAYRCRGDDEWIAIAVHNEQEWKALTAEMKSPGWTRDPKFATGAARQANQDELDKLIGEFTHGEDRYDLMARLQERGVAAAVVQTAADRCARDPQLKQGDYFVPLPHSEIGTWPVEGFPARFESMRVAPGGVTGRGAPLMGGDNDYVYRELLGLSPEEITKLQEELTI